MAVDSSSRIGRRSLLAAATGAIAALAGHAVTAPSRALAADGDPLKIGQVNDGVTKTILEVPAQHALEVHSGGGDALRGWSDGAAKSGLYAWNTNAGGYGIVATNTATGNIGSIGGPLDGVAAIGTRGGNAGVRGTSSHEGGYGMIAANSNQKSTVYLGGWAGIISEAPDQGYALVASGKILLERSGVVTVAKGKKTAKVSSVALSDGSFVFATMQYPRSGVYIAAALPNVDTDSITIYLNKAVTYDTKVAWVVLDRMVQMQQP
jgi:hypothetical protein